MPSPPRTFDHELVATHLRRRPAARDDFVTALVLTDLADRLLAVSRQFRRAVIVAPDASAMPASLRTMNGEVSFERVSSFAAPRHVDPEALVLPGAPHDLIVSVLDLQLVNDVPGFLARVRAQLQPDGLFLAAFLGGNSLAELRQAFLQADARVHGGAYARVAPFIQLADCGGLLQRAGFALPVIDVETHQVRYRTPLHLMREIKQLGASNPLAERPDRLATRTLLAAAAAAYQESFGDPDGRVRATIEIIWLSGWAPHESQQKPLRPGSARTSLAAVLGDKSGGD